jgi:hypothetical protein
MSAQIEDGMGPLTEGQLVQAERTLGVVFPADYRAFMREHNGGRPEPDGFAIAWRPGQKAAAAGASSMVSWFFSIHDGPHENLLRMNQVTFSGRLPQGTIAIGRDPGSNLLLLRCDDSPQRGELQYWLMEMERRGDNLGRVAASFDEFLQSRLR